MFSNKKILEKTKSINFIYGIYGIIAINLAYSFSVYFLKFLFFTNIEKLIVLCGLSFFLFSILVLLSKEAFPEITKFLNQYSVNQKLVGLVIAFGLSILSVFASLPYLPTPNIFELKVIQEDSISSTNNRVDIMQINRTRNINQKIKQISPYDLILNGNWDIEKKSLSLLSKDGGSIQFQDFSNNGISLLLRKSPDSAKVQINWNGTSQIIDLKSDKYDQIVIDFPHKFSVYNMSLFTIVQEFFLLISNYFSIIFLFFLFVLIYYQIRELKSYFKLLLFLQKTLVVVIILTICLNFYEILRYQATDNLNLRRSSSNTLIALDNANEDNYPYYQVYFKLFQYFDGFKLIIPREKVVDGTLNNPRLKEESLLELGRLSSVEVADYVSTLSTHQREKIIDMERDIIPPVGKFQTSFEYYFEIKNQNDVICLWSDKETIYFIPVQDGFDCQMRNK